MKALTAVPGDSLGTEETGFLAGMEVDLDLGGGLESGVNQGAEDLKGVDDTGPILTGRNEVSIAGVTCDLETNVHC